MFLLYIGYRNEEARVAPLAYNTVDEMLWPLPNRANATRCSSMFMQVFESTL